MHGDSLQHGAPQVRAHGKRVSARMSRGRMSRLAYISNSLLPSRSANSIHCMKMASAFQSAGVSTLLVAYRGDGDAHAPDTLATLYGTRADFAIRRLAGLRIRGAGGLYIACAIGLSLLWRADVIYTRVPRIAAAACAIRRRTVLELHYAIEPHTQAAHYLRRFLASRHAVALVVITEALRRRVLRDFDCAPHQVVVAPDGADEIETSAGSADRPPSHGGFRVGYVGHLYPGKGMELIEALAKRLDWVRFVIVGGTEKDLAYWRERTRSQSNIVFEGYVAHPCVASHLASFDVALLPNRASVAAYGSPSLNIGPWTSPLKAFEYMAAGLPIVASDQANLREVLEHDDNALLCPTDDVDAWVAALEKLRGDPGLRNRLGASARARFLERYTWTNRARMLIDMMSDR